MYLVDREHTVAVQVGALKPCPHILLRVCLSDAAGLHRIEFLKVEFRIACGIVIGAEVGVGVTACHASVREWGVLARSETMWTGVVVSSQQTVRIGFRHVVSSAFQMPLDSPLARAAFSKFTRGFELGAVMLQQKWVDNPHACNATSGARRELGSFEQATAQKVDAMFDPRVRRPVNRFHVNRCFPQTSTHAQTLSGPSTDLPGTSNSLLGRILPTRFRPPNTRSHFAGVQLTLSIERTS